MVKSKDGKEERQFVLESGTSANYLTKEVINEGKQVIEQPNLKERRENVMRQIKEEFGVTLVTGEGTKYGTYLTEKCYETFQKLLGTS